MFADIVRCVFGYSMQFRYCQSQSFYAAISWKATSYDLCGSVLLFDHCITSLSRYIAHCLSISFQLDQIGKLLSIKLKMNHPSNIYTHAFFYFQNAWIFTGIGLSYVLSSALLALSIWEYHSDGWVPKRTRRQLSVAAGIGLSCAFFAFILSWIHGRSGSTCKRQGSHDHISNQLYKPVDNSSSSGVRFLYLIIFFV